MQVAKTLGRIGEQQDIARLRYLLCDAEWWVRYSAAEALAHLPFMSITQLKTLQASLPDDYASDMSEHILSKEPA